MLRTRSPLGQHLDAAPQVLPELMRSLTWFAARVDVEAVLQETLLRVRQVAPNHQPDGRPDSLLRLAIRVGRNLASTSRRRRRRGAQRPTCPPASLSGT